MLKSLFGKTSGEKRAQAAIAVLFVAAIGLIFYAVTMNIGRISQTKTIVTNSSNVATSQLASSAASYGQQLYQTHLDASFKKCGKTGALKALVSLVIAVIGGLVLTIISGGTLAPLAVIGIVSAGAGLAVQAAIVQPSITKGFNDSMKQILTDEQMFVEQALFTALQTSGTDQGVFSDQTDLDGDRRFEGSPVGDDEVSRFAILYAKRMRDMSPKGYVAAREYVEKVRIFLYGGQLGLTDKPGFHCQEGIGDIMVIGGPLTPSECNPCCLPATIEVTNTNTGEVETHELIAEGCDQSPCATATPYPGFPYVFDPNYNDPWDDYKGVLEKIGRDDHHELYNRRFLEATLDEEEPPGADRYGHPNQIPQAELGLTTVPEGFYFGDAEGYYQDDMREGVFPFFWQAKHFGVDLDLLTKTKPMYPECMWCDPADPANAFVDLDPDVDSNGDGDYLNDLEWTECAPCYADMIVLNHVGANKTPVTQLSLGPMTGLEYDVAPGFTVNVLRENNYFVDGPGSSVDGEPPLGVDMIGETNQAYMDLMGTDASNPFGDTWREGAPFYCSTEWPYEQDCYDNAGLMDKMDWIGYTIRQYTNFALDLIRNPDFAANHIGHWTPEIEMWNDRLHDVSKAMDDVLTRLKEWKNQTYMTPGCSTAWCVPGDPLQCSSPVPSGEMETFGDGMIENVAECLEWNSDPEVGGLGGNAERFRQCLATCSFEACTDLPRSLVPDFNPNVDYSFDGNCDPNTSAWAANMIQSIAEAQKQGIKMAMRAKFLRSLIDRRERIINVLRDAKLLIDTFLMADPPGPGAPPDNSVIYGWKDDDNGEMGTPGLWHFVKAEAKIPSRLPWLDSYTEGALKTKRCYELKGRMGTVQVTVTRFDQPYSPGDSEKLKVKFGKSDRLLWKFWTHNPLQADEVASKDLSNIATICQNDGAYATDIDGNYIENAFIVSDASGPNCTEIVESVLPFGISSTTCALYGDQHSLSGGFPGFPGFPDDNTNSGFSFKFVSCN